MTDHRNITLKPYGVNSVSPFGMSILICFAYL